MVFTHNLKRTGKIGTLFIQTVHKRATRNSRFTRKFPGTRSTKLRTVNSINHHQRSVSNTNTANHFTDKFTVSGSIYKKEMLVLPFAVQERSINT